jgi:hypothetical protein
MARIMAALITGNDIEPLGKKINNLALTFIAPLGADYDYYHACCVETGCEECWQVVSSQ